VTDLTPERVREMLSPEHPTMFPEVFDLGASWLMQRDTIERLRAELRDAIRMVNHFDDYKQGCATCNEIRAFLARQEKP
jgi:hypothetical protein